MELNMEELASYICDKLLIEGIVVKFDDILRVLDLEMDYMVENGFAEVAE